MTDRAKRSWLRLNLAVGLGLMVAVTAAAVYLLATGTAERGALFALGVVVVSGLIFIVFGRLHRKQGNL